jgi:hypothetical protein
LGYARYTTKKAENTKITKIKNTKYNNNTTTQVITALPSS